MSPMNPPEASSPDRSVTFLDAGRIIELARAANSAKWPIAMESDYGRQMNEFLLLLQRRKIPFVVVGGIALLQYVPGRNTEDLDIILAAPRLLEIPELKVTEQNDMFAKADLKGLRIDLLFFEHPFFNRIACDFSTDRHFSVGSLRTATVEGLVLLKLFALPSLYRQFDLDRAAIYEADLVQLVSRTDCSDSFFLGLLAEFMPASDLRELGAVLLEIRQKIRRFQRGDHRRP
jgi:hypothetical protein